MARHARATFEVTNWEENPFHEEPGGPKLTRATVTKTFSGDLEGQATVEYLMVHRPDSTAAFVGIEQIKGTLGGQSGSFVLEHRGIYEEGIAKAICRVVPNSGTEGLKSLQGEGGFEAEGKKAPFTLEYELAD